ncbi:MAG: hypothetical protein FWC39_01445 [Bacteroidetes bacterium]|nr:hypothetical protein [Bacteroidota bacterium]
MKRIGIIVSVFAFIAVSCGQTSKNTKTTDVGVVINGVTWATRNVDAFGTFAETPESSGMFYQWNRKTAWNTTDAEVGGWDDTHPAGTTWEKANDPSPKGWRVPTKEEQQSLLDTCKVTNEWTAQNGVTGRKFTDITTGNTLFFPAVGFRHRSIGELSSVGKLGGYWSSTQSVKTHAYCLVFFLDEDDAYMNSYGRRLGFSVRSVLAE